MSREVAAFSIRVLVVSLGSYNTVFGQNCHFLARPLHTDYEDSATGRVIKFMNSGAFVAQGDKDKAAKVIYEFAVGEGVGKGHEAETLLPLSVNSEAAEKVGQAVRRYQRAMELFEGLGISVATDTE